MPTSLVLRISHLFVTVISCLTADLFHRQDPQILPMKRINCPLRGRGG